MNSPALVALAAGAPPEAGALFCFLLWVPPPTPVLSCLSALLVALLPMTPHSSHCASDAAGRDSELFSAPSLH